MGILGAGISVLKSTLTRLVPGVAGSAEDTDDASAGARAAWARVDAAKKEVAAAEAAAEEAREQHAEMQQQADEARCGLHATLVDVGAVCSNGWMEPSLLAASTASTAFPGVSETGHLRPGHFGEGRSARRMQESQRTGSAESSEYCWYGVRRGCGSA